jgi:hypothetical protein
MTRDIAAADIRDGVPAPANDALLHEEAPSGWSRMSAAGYAWLTRQVFA